MKKDIETHSDSDFFLDNLFQSFQERDQRDMKTLKYLLIVTVLVCLLFICSYGLVVLQYINKPLI